MSEKKRILWPWEIDYPHENDTSPPHRAVVEFSYHCQNCGEWYVSRDEQRHIFLCPRCLDDAVGY